MKLPFFTIGHSNRSLEEFIELLGGSDIQIVADIRTIPKSRTNPQFNKDTLPEDLATVHVSYVHLAALGGRRGRLRTLSPDINGFWTHESFHNYADYAMSANFHVGLDQLLDEGRRHRCAIMCSEAVWWRCHRRIVTAYLIARDETVFHIMGRGRVELAHLTQNAVIQPGGTIVYPRVNQANRS